MTERLTHCAGCTRELRAQTDPARPGTARRATKQLCDACYYRMQRHGTLQLPEKKVLSWQDCKNCERPMRSGDTKAADHPGTIAHGKQGYCTSCTRHLSRTGEYGNPHIKRPHVNNMPLVIDTTAPGADTLNAYMRGRAARLARGKKLAAIRAKYGIAA